MLVIKKLTVFIGKKEVIKGVDLKIKPGEVGVVMGPNAAGKSTLAQAIAGQPGYKVRGGVKLDNKEILGLAVDERAKKGLWVSFQNPVGIGAQVGEFLSQSLMALQADDYWSLGEIKEIATKEAKKLGLKRNFWKKNLNQSFSGGEKKRLELLQALVLKPKYVIFDEIDSGMDVEGRALVGQVVARLKKRGAGILLITHQPEILKVIKPKRIHVLIDGQIVKSGNSEILERLKISGYKSFYCALCECQGEICPECKTE